MKAKIGVVMCPAWSLETPPLSLGLLAGALQTRGRKVKIQGYKKAIITLKKGQSIDLTSGI